MKTITSPTRSILLAALLCFAGLASLPGTAQAQPSISHTITAVSAVPGACTPTSMSVPPDCPSAVTAVPGAVISDVSGSGVGAPFVNVLANPGFEGDVTGFDLHSSPEWDAYRGFHGRGFTLYSTAYDGGLFDPTDKLHGGETVIAPGQGRGGGQAINAGNAGHYTGLTARQGKLSMDLKEAVPLAAVQSFSVYVKRTNPETNPISRLEIFFTVDGRPNPTDASTAACFVAEPVLFPQGAADWTLYSFDTSTSFTISDGGTDCKGIGGAGTTTSTLAQAQQNPDYGSSTLTSVYYQVLNYPIDGANTCTDAQHGHSDSKGGCEGSKKPLPAGNDIYFDDAAVLAAPSSLADANSALRAVTSAAGVPDPTALGCMNGLPPCLVPDFHVQYSFNPPLSSIPGSQAPGAILAFDSGTHTVNITASLFDGSGNPLEFGDAQLTWASVDTAGTIANLPGALGGLTTGSPPLAAGFAPDPHGVGPLSGHTVHFIVNQAQFAASPAWEFNVQDASTTGPAGNNQEQGLAHKFSYYNAAANAVGEQAIGAGVGSPLWQAADQLDAVFTPLSTSASATPASVGDGLVAQFNLPDVTTTGAAPVLDVSKDLTLTAHVQSKDAETGLYADYTGNLRLFAKADCGPIAQADPTSTCSQGNFDHVAGSAQVGSTNGDYSFTIPLSALQSNVFPSGSPATAVNLFIAVDDGHTVLSSHYFLPAQLVLASSAPNAAATADSLEQLSFSPVLLVDSSSLPTGDGLVASFKLPDITTMGAVPALDVSNGLTVTAHVQGKNADGNYEDFTGKLRLFAKADCGPIGQVDQTDCAQSPYDHVAGSAQVESTNGDYSFTIPLSDLQSNVFPTGSPATAVNLFVGVDDGATPLSSHYFLPAQLVLASSAPNAPAMADSLEQVSFSPVLLFDSSSAPAGDGLVASFKLPDVTTTGAVPALDVSTGLTVTAHVQSKDAETGLYADYTGNLRLFAKADCGPIGQADPTNTCSQGNFDHVAGSAQVGSTNGDYSFTIPLSDLQSNVFPSGSPATGVNLFIAVDDGHTDLSSHYFLPAQLVLASGLPNAAATADLLEKASFTPVILASAPQVPPQVPGPIHDLLDMLCDPVSMIPMLGPMVLIPALQQLGFCEPASVPDALAISAGPAAAEPSTNSTFIITRGGSTAAAQDVTFTVSGTATRGSDYDLKTGSDCASGTVISSDANKVTIAAGETSAMVLLCVIDDSAPESTESVTLNISGNTPAPDPATATVSIQDDDTPSLGITGGAPAGEPTTNSAFTITRGGSHEAAQVVTFTVGGTATRGTDYTLKSGADCATGTAISPDANQVTIAAGETSAAVNLCVIDDTIQESTETVTLDISGNTPAPDPAIATVGILDNDATPTLNCPGNFAPNPGPGDGDYAMWGATLDHSISNLVTPRGDGLPYVLHYQDDGTLTLDGWLFDSSDPTTPITSGHALICLQLDCGLLATPLAMACQKLGLDGTTVSAPATIRDTDGYFKAVFKPSTIQPLFTAFEKGVLGTALTTGPLAAAERIPLRLVATHEGWGTLADPVGSNFNAASQALAGQNGLLGPGFVSDLTAADAMEDAAFTPLFLPPPPPLAVEAGGPYSGVTGQAIAITATTDPSGATCAWTGGTGATFQDASACSTTVQYATAGDDTITVTATLGGNTVASTAAVHIDTAPPVFTALPGGPYSGVAGQPTTITGSATGGTPPYTCSWSDDADPVRVFGDAQQCSTTVEYPYPGDFTLHFFVQDSASGTADAFTSIHVVAPPALAVGAGGPYSGFVNQPIHVQATPSGGFAPYGCQWKVQDANDNDVQNAFTASSSDSSSCSGSVVLSTAGTYTLTVAVTDNHGTTASSTTSASVSADNVVIQPSQTQSSSSSSSSSSSTTSDSSTSTSASETSSAASTSEQTTSASEPSSQTASSTGPTETVPANAALVSAVEQTAGVDLGAVSLVKDAASGQVVGIQDASNSLKTLHVSPDQALVFVQVVSSGATVLMDVATNQAYAVANTAPTTVSDKVADTGKLTVTVAQKVGWIDVAMPDPYPNRAVQDVIAGNATGVQRTIPGSLIWREGGKLHFLDDPTTTYTLTFAPATKATTVQQPSSFPWALAVAGIILVGSLTLLVVAVRRDRKAKPETASEAL